MHRVIWSVLTGVGAFLVVLALLLRFFLPGQAVKFPLNEYAKATLIGNGVSYFSAKSLSLVTGVKMEAINTVSGDVPAADAAGSSHIAVWRAFSAVRDLTNNFPFQYTYESLAFDRRTGQLVNCCGNVIGSHRNPHVSGQGFVFPFNTQQHDYQVFDTTLLRPVRFAYAGRANIDGTNTYKFVEHVNNQQVGTQTVPGSLVGASASAITLPEYYTIAKTEWVNPVTGTPVKIDQNETVTLQDSTGATRLLLFQGDLSTQPDAMQRGIAADNANAAKIQLIEVTGPIVTGALGIVLIAAGLILSRRRPEDQEVHEEDIEPVGSPS